MHTITLHRGERRTLTASPLEREEVRICLAPHSHFTLLLNDSGTGEYACQTECGRGSYCRIVHLAHKGQGSDSRQNISVNLAEPDAVFEYFGLCNAAQNASVHTCVQVLHSVPHCTSRQLFKAIADGDAQVHFGGKITAAHGAQQTTAVQTSKGILLTAGARISAMPQLEIYADDVKCSHGAAIGHLDEEQMFYLRARGIAKGQAREMLLNAFAQEILDQMPAKS